MPVHYRCGGCGQDHLALSTTSGFRKACKACGRMLVVPGDGKPVEGAGVADIVTPPVKRWFRVFGLFYPTGWVLLACLGLITLFAAIGPQVPDYYYEIAAGFFILGGLFFVIGTVNIFIKTLRRPTEFRVPLRDILFVGAQVLTAHFITLPGFVHRIKMFENSEWGDFFRETGGLFVRSIAVAAMPFGMFLLSQGIYRGCPESLIGRRLLKSKWPNAAVLQIMDFPGKEWAEGGGN